MTRKAARAAGLLGVLLLFGAAAAARADMAGHGGPVRALAATPDGRTLASGGFDYGVMLWDAPAEAEVARLLAHEGPVSGVALAPDGRLAVSVGDDGQAIGWDLAARVVRWRVRADAKLAAVALSPDGALAAAGGWDGEVRLLRAADGSPAGSFDLPGERVTAVAFLGDGAVVAAGGHLGTVRLHHAADGTPLRHWRAHGLGVAGLAAAGGVLATAGADRLVRLWDAGGGGLLRELAGHERPVSALALSPDGRWAASGSVDGQVVLWDASEGAAAAVLRPRAGPVWALAFGGGALHAGGADGVVRRWSVPSGEPLGAPAATPLQAAAARPPEGHGRGAALFRKCAACHTLGADGGNRAGPSLLALFGRRAGGLPGYAYSRALSDSGIVWTEETVARLFEVGPDVLTPGSKMPLQLVPDAADRAALVAYLKAATAGGP